MTVCIAGQITGDPNYRAKFAAAEREIQKNDHVVLNLAALPEGLGWQERMTVCLAMVTVSDILYVLPDWQKSRGAIIAHDTTQRQGKIIVHADDGETVKPS